MSLARRLQALEQRARQHGLLTDEPPCPSCGGPDPLNDRIVIVNSTKGEVLQHCPICDRPVDAQGRDLGVNGDAVFLHFGCVDVPLPS